MAGTVWLRRAVLTLILLPGFAGAADPTPDSHDIIKKLSPASLNGSTRGIKAIKPRGPEEAPPPSIDLAIPFATGSATVAPSGSKIIAALGQALASPELSGSRFKIEGHADTVGQEAANLALSQRRAASVAAVLSARYGIKSSRLDPVGVGDASLVVQTASQVDEPRNRVVRVINLGP